MSLFPGLPSRIIRSITKGSNVKSTAVRSFSNSILHQNWATMKPVGHPLSAKGLSITKTDTPKPLVPKEKLTFGSTYSDHMLEVDWNDVDGWGNPYIRKYQDMLISPAASSLHYALQCFEGMKAYKDKHGNLRLFRPDCNMQRLNDSMARLYMPSFDGEEWIKCIKELVKLDSKWVPEGEGFSMYLRPTAISTYPYLGVGPTKMVKLFVITCPVGPYYPEGFKPVKLYADTDNVRAWPGGVGNTKLGGNYGPTIAPQMKALEKGYSQVLWLHGKDHEVTEVGAMNLFFYIVNDAGEKELVTAPLTRGDILPGVTRRSILELAKSWNVCKVSERYLKMADVVKMAKEGRVLEVFGAGTAAVISPVSVIHYKGEDIQFLDPKETSLQPFAKRVWDELLDIQYGNVEHAWSWKI